MRLAGRAKRWLREINSTYHESAAKAYHSTYLSELKNIEEILAAESSRAYRCGYGDVANIAMRIQIDRGLRFFLPCGLCHQHHRDDRAPLHK